MSFDLKSWEQVEFLLLFNEMMDTWHLKMLKSSIDRNSKVWSNYLTHLYRQNESNKSIEYDFQFMTETIYYINIRFNNYFWLFHCYFWQVIFHSDYLTDISLFDNIGKHEVKLKKDCSVEETRGKFFSLEMFKKLWKMFFLYFFVSQTFVTCSG